MLPRDTHAEEEGGGQTKVKQSKQQAWNTRNHVLSPPARGLLIHCECPVADAGAGVECGWKPGGRSKMVKHRPQRCLKRQAQSFQKTPKRLHTVPRPPTIEG